MSLHKDLLDFHKGETVEITVLAKERDGTVLADAATAVMSITFAEDEGDVIFLEFNASPQVALNDGPTGNFTITLTATDLTTLSEQSDYYYNVWTETSGGAGFKLQVSGVINLLNSTKPT